MRASPLLISMCSTAAVLFGCGGGGAKPLAQVATGGGSVALTFMPLGGGVSDLIVASPDRDDFDVLEHESAGYRQSGSFYSGGRADALTAGRIGGRDVIIARVDGGSLVLAANDPSLPHRLVFPIDIYRRRHDGRTVDNTPAAQGYAVADLDSDGSDEVVVASALGVVVLQKVASVIDLNPDFPPPVGGFVLTAGGQPNAVALLDFDGDGRRDILALDAVEPVLRVYYNQGGQGGQSGSSPGFTDGNEEKIALPAAGTAVLATDCAASPLLVRLGDGRVIAISSSRKVTPVANAPTPVSAAAVGSGTLAFIGQPSAQVSILDACAVGAARHDLDVAHVKSVALDDGGRLATLADDGQTVTVFQIGGS